MHGHVYGCLEMAASMINVIDLTTFFMSNVSEMLIEKG